MEHTLPNGYISFATSLSVSSSAPLAQIITSPDMGGHDITSAKLKGVPMSLRAMPAVERNETAREEIEAQVPK